MQTTTQRPATLAERILEGKRRELDEFRGHCRAGDGTFGPDDYLYLQDLEADIAWMERRLAEKAVPHG